MPKSLTVLIKPVSGSCNLRCKYCFYIDIMNLKNEHRENMMSISTFRNVVKRTYEAATESCTFAFQGGEPTLAGLDFFKEVVRIEKELNKNNISVTNSIQTNATLIDDQWAKFFAENKFLVGVSLDGTKHVHDLCRRYQNDKGSYEDVIRGIDCLNKYNVSYNILTVVTNEVAKNIVDIYKLYRKLNFSYLQFIPCYGPIESNWKDQHTYLSATEYGVMLCKLFDLWYQDILNGEQVYIRYFDNLINIISGLAPETCGLSGHCSCQFVIDGNGDVYPCDFFVMDRFLLGNVEKNSFSDMFSEWVKSFFFNRPQYVNEKCKVCQYYKLCGGGCCREWIMDKNNYNENYFCESYLKFFNYSYDHLVELAKGLLM